MVDCEQSSLVTEATGGAPDKAVVVVASVVATVALVDGSGLSVLVAVARY